MTIGIAYAQWEGDLRTGSGTVQAGPGCGGEIGFASRFEGDEGMTPEMLLGGALAACFSMALGGKLAERVGHPARLVETSAEVALERTGDGYSVGRIVLNVLVDVEGVPEDEVRALVEETKRTCPIGKALAAVTIEHAVTLGSGSGREP